MSKFKAVIAISGPNRKQTVLPGEEFEMEPEDAAQLVAEGYAKPVIEPVADNKVPKK